MFGGSVGIKHPCLGVLLLVFFLSNRERKDRAPECTETLKSQSLAAFFARKGDRKEKGKEGAQDQNSKNLSRMRSALTKEDKGWKLGGSYWGCCTWARRHFPISFFPLFFFVFLCFSLALLEDKGKRLQFTANMGNFTLMPSAPTPCKTSRQWFHVVVLQIWSLNLLLTSIDGRPLQTISASKPKFAPFQSQIQSQPPANTLTMLTVMAVIML